MSHLFAQHPAAAVLKDFIKPYQKPAVKPVLDKCDDKEMVMDAAESYAMADLTVKAVNALQEWVETDDLDEGEGLGDRLFALMVGLADADMDGEIGDDEIAIFEEAANAAGDYLSEKGVSDDDIGALLNDFDNEVAARVQELLAERLPEGDAASEEADMFAFGEGEALDAVYKKKIAIRKGKKVWVNKRISGTVRLSAKQKLAIRKAVRKSGTAKAQMRRMKSMRIRRQMVR